jgi:beta-phosphoglucomutase-like phosphatase (HAD superfamily)
MGITAAHAAGMRVVAIASSFSAAQFKALAEPPDLVCRDFDELLMLTGW